MRHDLLIPNLLKSQPLGEQIHTLFYQRLQAGWLVNIQCEDVLDLAQRKLAVLIQSQANFSLISTRDPIEFIAEFMVSCKLELPIFLGNPQWGIAEWERVNSLTTKVDRDRDRHRMMIPTGGSSGKIEFVIHTWETLSASVWGFQEFYGVDKINCICVLPLYHVSGLMQLWRSLLTDGNLLIADYHQICTSIPLPILPIEIENYFISLVPTQLYKLLDLHPNWLAKFQMILLGGAPPNIELLTRSRIAKLPLALTYGMTETASQITSLNPTEFLAGNNSCGRILPHAQINISALTDRSASIQIKAKSLMLGYFPNLRTTEYLDTDDLGSIDDRGYLTILGRNSGKIITGGENILPIEVVNAIMATGLVIDVWVVGLPDAYWGQIVTAIYVEGELPVSGDILASAIGGKISNYKIPKAWLSVTQIPRNSLGKILTQEVEKIALKIDRSSSISDA